MDVENITTFDFNKLDNFNTIYCLISGGFDSTYLMEYISEMYPEKTIGVNCYNPYEYSKTLKQIDENFPVIFIKPNTEKYRLGEILRRAFKRLPKAKKLKQKGKYNKKIFGCCQVFKHDMFKRDERFCEDGTVVVSGIKDGDGSQRRGFLRQLKKGKKTIGTSKSPNNYYYKINGEAKPTFFHKHIWGATYCYPFRDYSKRDLPKKIIEKLREKYPNLDHSGCSICPVLVLFDIKSEGERYKKSIEFARKMNVIDNKKEIDFSQWM